MSTVLVTSEDVMQRILILPSNKATRRVWLTAVVVWILYEFHLHSEGS